jgi:hypothetical protein|uniref:Uncharacterized protein n=1 Tax=Myoviridae sp. ctu2j3 TaxID=2825197 RepID=A0A8S5UHX5_9CAUD|nr:MAG TPA: hypothetical protein [Myoviridae sp. ctu2j3]DAF94334.1 MAG TPA: hypothetical protein [Myoviridae sp. ctu2j3]
MIASGASIALYCDSGRKHPWDYFPHEYFDNESVGACRKQARRDGWRIGPDGSEGQDLCPLCNPRSPKFVKEPA